MKRQTAALAALLALCFGVSILQAQEARWVKTHTWIGHGTRQTEMVTILGEKWRVRYRPEGEGLFQVALYNADHQLLDMVADQNRSFLLAGITTLQGRGKRYLGISGLTSSWTVTLEQYVTLAEEWQLRQLLQAGPPAVFKLGTWTGGAGTATYQFNVTSGSWRVDCSQADAGLFQVEISDERGLVTLAANGVRAGRTSSWIHKTGTFSMTVKSDGPTWQVDVLTPP